MQELKDAELNEYKRKILNLEKMIDDMHQRGEDNS